MVGCSGVLSPQDRPSKLYFLPELEVPASVEGSSVPWFSSASESGADSAPSILGRGTHLDQGRLPFLLHLHLGIEQRFQALHRQRKGPLEFQ